MIPYLLQVVMCMAVFYAFYHIALRKETLFASNRAYLLITLLLSFILPLVSIYIESQQSSPIMEGPLYVATYVQTFGEGIVVTPQPKAFNWTFALWIAYTGVVLILLVRMVCSVYSILRIKRNGEAKLVAGQQCIISAEIKCPFSFFNTIYMPMHHQFSDDEIAEVVSHERTHVAGRHTLDVLFVELACILLWFNPVVYFYRKALKELHEFMADAAVIASTPWDHYAQLLIANKDNAFQTRLSHHLIFSQLKKRLLMMNKQRSGMAGKMKYLGILPILVIALVLFSFREKHQTANAAETSSLHVNEGIDPILYITVDNRYFLDGKELAYAELADALKVATQHETEWKIAVVIDSSSTVGDIVDILDIGDKQNIQMKIHTGEEWDAYKTKMDRRIAEAKTYNIYDDGLPLTIIPNQNQNDNVSRSKDQPQPIFPGCENVAPGARLNCSTEKLYAYVNANLVYPESLKKIGIAGKVFVKFIVSKEGWITDIAIMRSLHPEADAAVLQLVTGMKERAGKWIPAMKEGQTIDAEMILPVSFVLEKEPMPLMYAEEMPRLEGCEHIADLSERMQCATSLMYDFIAKNISYPKADKDNNVEGTGIVQFVIRTDGSMADIQVVRSPSETITSEVKRIFLAMAAAHRWIPAKEKGKPVDLKFTVPVKFVLQKDEPLDDTKEVKPGGVTVITESRVGVSPNPVSTTVTVKLFAGAHTVNILDAAGKQVMSQRVSSEQMEVSIFVEHLPAGKYIVQVVSKEDVKSSTLIKQ